MTRRARGAGDSAATRSAGLAPCINENLGLAPQGFMLPSASRTLIQGAPDALGDGFDF